MKFVGQKKRGIIAPCHASTAGRGAGARVACPVATASAALRTTPAPSTSVALRRSRSYDNLPGKGAHCLACWTANKGHKGHVYAGDCQVIPGRSLWANQRPHDRAALVDQPAVQPQQSIAETAVGPHFTDIPVPEHGSFGSAVSLHGPPLAPHAPSEGEQADSRRFQQLEVNVQELRAELQGTREEMASVVTAQRPQINSLRRLSA